MRLFPDRGLAFLGSFCRSQAACRHGGGNAHGLEHFTPAKSVGLLAVFGVHDHLLPSSFIRSSRRRSLVAEVDDDFLDLAGEFERHVVVLAHGRAGVFADVEGFIKLKRPGMVALMRPCSHLLAVHAERAGAALADAAAVVFEVKNNGVLAGCKGVLGRNVEVRDVRQVVMENRLPSLNISA